MGRFTITLVPRPLLPLNRIPCNTQVCPHHVLLEELFSKVNIPNAKPKKMSPDSLENKSADILKSGGNAVDAAVAVAAALNVTEPCSTGLGGDCFCLYYDANTKQVYGLNGSGRSPQSLTLALLKERGFDEANPPPSQHACNVTVPGAAAGWCDAVELFGSKNLSMGQILQPAIELAEKGFPVSEITSYHWERNAHVLQAAGNPHGKDLLIDGQAPEHGQVFHNPLLANTFKELAKSGKQGFYEGRVAKAIIEILQNNSGVMNSEDLKNHVTEEVKPIVTNYKSVNVWEIPPNGQGITALLALNILENFNVKEMGHNTANYLHILIEALKISFSDAFGFCADPEKVSVPTTELLSKSYARNRSQLIDLQRATYNLNHGNPFSVGSDTVYFTVVDGQGNACSFVNSNYMGFVCPLLQSLPGMGIDLGGTADEDIDSGVLFGTLRGNVVGLRYYTGVVNNNEMVELQREPNNRFDVNAIKVNNVNGEQVGHIKKELAACLAHIMDSKLALIEGVVPYGAKNAFTMPVQLSFWGKAENEEAVLRYLKKYGFKLAPPEKCLGFGYSGTSSKAGTSYSAPVHAAVQMTTEQLKTEFDKLFEDLKEDDKTREMEAAGAVLTPLLPHQKQALAWMISRENNKELPPFWEKRENYFYNTITNFAEKKRPENVLGGILADDMGLGKTLTTIAVILTNFHGGRPLPLEKKSDQLKEKYVSTVKSDLKVPISSDTKEENDSVLPQSSHPKSQNPNNTARNKKKEERNLGASCDVVEDNMFASALGELATTSKKTKKKGGATVQSKKTEAEENLRATLIICPLSVLSNWTDQFEQHIDPAVHLNIYVYYGSERTKDPAILSRQDIVLTTYNVLASDYSAKSNSTLHSFKWLRVVLDEGHTIRNPNAQQTKAILDLDAQRRWILTGTPIQNSLKDLWSLLSFLKLKPFTDREWWRRTIQRPVTMGDQGGLKRLQSLIKSITLRRTKTSKVKGEPVLKLPDRKVFIQHITLTEEENLIYHSVKKESKAAIIRYFNEGTVLAHYADVLGALLRLRQMCCHPHLCASAPPSTFEEGDGTPEQLRSKLIEKMKQVLSSGSDEECAICLDSLSIPVITHCAHVYCKPCICEVIQKEKPNAKCPLCRKEVGLQQLIECPLEDADTEKSDQEWVSSSKINALMHALLELRKQNPAIKSIVVSQFTKFLSLIEIPLRKSGFLFTRLDGRLSKKKRVEAIQQFQSAEAGSPAVMLLSLKAGGVGLNLTAASQVFLMDPAWNPAAEDQCFDRCHRLGQKQDVIITKFIVKHSVEENMLKIQNKKRELAAGAFGAKKPSSSETKINEIKTLIDF
uniref:helicase-like transcription factor n=1 Tax=Euleptes europaea TaxID=460621 RepID=UPI002540F510|nr:helicase-like transcription factor [Euleptes europaea]